MNAGTLLLLGTLTAGGQPGPLPVPGLGPPAGVAGVPPVGPPPFLPPGPPPGPALGHGAPAPVLPAKVITPAGTRVVAYPGTPLARAYEPGAVFAFRPGYAYRLELWLDETRRLYPEIEIRGTLVPRPSMRYMDYPIPLVFTAEDIARVLAGVMITKVVYLEDPEKALPVPVNPNAPIETPNDTEQQAIKAALDNGRLVAIVRLGNRPLPPEILRVAAVPGTILLPGEQHLRSPLAPPMFPFYACPLYDPIAGPKGPKEECFLDGGDRGDPLGIGRNGVIGGLNPTDVGVEYSMNGKRRVTTSNVVCICSPRFLIQRAELVPGGVYVPVVPSRNFNFLALQGYKERRVPMLDVGRERPTEVDGRLRPAAYVGRVGTAFFVGTSRPNVIGVVESLKVVGVVVEPEEMTAYPSLCPLTVTKSVDPPGPVPAGEVVTITIRYANTGNKPITDVAVNDSLSGRLEYVPGSAQTDRAANFSAAENEAGSVVVRWEFPGSLLPGQKGVVKFKARVR